VLRQLHIQNFRALRNYRLNDLSRVNLLVGTNNCGKTSVLEAIDILTVPGTFAPLWSALLRRGETPDDSAVDVVEGDIAHLVHGRALERGILFEISAANDLEHQRLTATLLEPGAEQQLRLDEIVSGGDRSRRDTVGALQLEWIMSDQARKAASPLNRRGYLQERAFMVQAGRLFDARPAPVQLVTTEGLTRDNVVALFNEVVLTADESTVLEALRTIEPKIERLASVGGARHYQSNTRGGIAMLVDGKRLPIGSMGDGIWRLLGIALALVRAEGGVLLVDEIDTGLHYSVLVDMWRLVYETATRLNVQVFATTHSRDCYEALAAITEPGRGDISLQRIERDQPVAVAFSESEIRAAAERGIEVR